MTDNVISLFWSWKKSSRRTLLSRKFSLSRDKRLTLYSPRRTLATVSLMYITPLKGLCHDSADVWALTVGDCFWTNRKRVRCTQGNLHNSRFIVRGRFCSILYIPIIHIYSLVFLRYMLQPIRIRLTTLSCFETNTYLRVFSRTYASIPVSDR